MKFGIIVVVVLLLSATAAHFLLSDPGYVAIHFRGYIIEMSVPVLVLLTAALIGLMPLLELLLEEFPGLRQPWYADDAAAQGDAEQLALWLGRLGTEGPKRGYRPEPAKSILLIHPGSDAAASRSGSPCRGRLETGRRRDGAG